LYDPQFQTTLKLNKNTIFNPKIEFLEEKTRWVLENNELTSTSSNAL